MTPHPVDRPLPQLDFVRKTSVMLRIFERAMPGQDIRDCAVLNARYKPGKSCLVSYRLTMAQNAGAASASQIVSARFYPPGGSLSRFRKAQYAALAAPAFGSPVFHVPDLDAVVWAFPNDRKLPGLPALIDEKRIACEVAPLLMKRAIGGKNAGKTAGGRVSLAVIRYIPEHGCTVRLTVHPEDGRRAMVFYGKTYCDESGVATYRNMGVLWNSRARALGTLQMAQPLAYEADHLALWQSAVEGPTLASVEASGPRFTKLLQAAGRAVAALHSETIPGLKPLATADLCDSLRKAELRIGSVRPLASRLARVVAQLLETADAGGMRPDATLHGDLHAKNVVFTGGPAALIDLDNLRTGDPMQDLGSFVASTCGRALGHEIGAPDIAPMVAALVRAYETSVPWEVPRVALRWHTAYALVAEQAYRTVVRLKVASLDPLLDLAEQALSGQGLMKVLL